MDGNYLDDIDYERENKIFQEGYQKGYYEAKWKTELEMANFLCLQFVIRKITRIMI